MTLSVAVIDELARALGEDLPPELRDALVRIEAAERGVTGVARDVTPASPLRAGPSKAALRTRRYRERMRAKAAGRPEGMADGGSNLEVESVTQASPPASPSVTEASPVTSHVTVGDGARQKNFPPHPPIRKYKNTKRGPSQRHSVTAQPVDQVELDPSDALYLEITAMRGGREPFVGKRGVAWVSAGEVAVARDRLAEKVRVLRPSTMAMRTAIGPPAASVQR